MKLGRFALLITMLGALAGADPAGAVTITEFDANPGKLATPNYIVAGPDGNLWWTESGAEPGIGRISPAGERFPIISDSGRPIDLAVAAGGWVSWVSEKGFGSRSPSGVVYRESSGSAGNFRAGSITVAPNNQVRFGGAEGASATVICSPKDPTSDHLETEFTCAGERNGNAVEDIAASPGGTLWASVSASNAVFISTVQSFGFTKRIDLPAGSRPVGIAIGPEGSAWVAMWEAGAIDRIGPDGSRTRFLLPPGSRPNDLVLGPDGAFWILESGIGRIARMTTAGVIADEYPIPSGETGQTGITVGPDGNLWFTDTEMGKIGRLVPDPLTIGGGGSSGGNPPAPPTDTAPLFTAAPAFSPARFRVAGPRAVASSNGGAPSGSTLKFSLSEAASVTATLALKAPGRRAGKNCVAPGKAKPGAQKCPRFVPRSQLKLSGKVGANKFAFSGKVGGKALAPGGYRATLVARDASGNSSAPASAKFTIVR
ncbi:MAG: hypothetical protein JSS97_04850 [Actinobacteria bacterium]|nr:hypothetical protein [Actinomycetota bacterium]